MTDEKLTLSSTNGGSRPVPDPTELTDRAIARLRAELLDHISGQLAIRDERLAGIDEATSLRLDQINHIPAQIADQVGRLADVTAERFTGIATQFRERDARSDRESQLNKIALDAAFSASKEAVAAAFAAQKEDANRRDEANGKAIDKSERATAETIKTNQELGSSQTQSLSKTVDELKERLTRIESARIGGTEQRDFSRQSGIDSRTLAFGLLGALGVIAAIVLGVIAALKP